MSSHSNSAASARPLVSVCIGVFNREDYIQQTLSDVFNQTYGELEIIVVDDASTDDTVGILESYADRIRLIKREKNSGICPVTRNQAWRAAKGKYVALLDSDDGWYPEKIARQVALLESNPELPLCHTYCRIMDEYSNEQAIRHEEVLPPTGDYFKALLSHCWITNSSVMMRRDLHEHVGGYFTEDPRYGIWGEDHEFYLRVARKYNIGLIPEVLTKYRKSSQSISAGNWKQCPESVPLHKMIIHRPDIWRGKVSRATVVKSFVGVCMENALYWYEQRKYGRALYFCGQALQQRPFAGKGWMQAAKIAGKAVFTGVSCKSNGPAKRTEGSRD